jgi:prepilin-type N-terminal cleavage/methylation domain-containing protein
MQNRNRTIRAFTLVEILTTVAIIGILLAVLLPALNQVSKSAVAVKQKAQFHTIEMGLEAFRTDIGDYPSSAYVLVGGVAYSGSQRLAEAMVGRDGLGVHPNSAFFHFGTDSLAAGGNELYYPGISGFTQDAKDNNLKQRKGPYLELESANAINMGDYPVNFGTLVNATRPSYVLADSYKTVKLTTGRKTGMPILYYKANRLYAQHNFANALISTYNVYDSVNGILDRLTPKHPLWGSPEWFYTRTVNPNFKIPLAERPYRAESFILHSAGHDGLFGTSDDVFNFDEGN